MKLYIRILSTLVFVSIKTDLEKKEASMNFLKFSGIRRVLRVCREIQDHAVRIEKEVNIVGRFYRSRRIILKSYRLQDRVKFTLRSVNFVGCTVWRQWIIFKEA